MDPTRLHDGLALLHRPALHQHPPAYLRRHPPLQVPHFREPDNDASHRIAHTLTACTRCRTRKTRCDPTLPRCIPCERTGSPCEYFDTTRNRKMSRSYVVDLQNKVRDAEAELAQYTEDDGPRDKENTMRQNGLVRPDGNERNGAPRFLGASSGIAMTQLLMDKAKRYTQSNYLLELNEILQERRRARSDRMQSIVMGSSISGPSGIRRDWPNRSLLPAERLPERMVTDSLVHLFQERVQIFAPILHEKVLADDVHAVYNGDKDPYKLFVVNMVVAISQKKVDKWNGLPDGYYLAAMQHFEEVVRAKDLKTLQCLLLIAQYSLLTPVDTAVYYVIGLAIRICQKMRLGDEKSIAFGVSDPRTVDMRRRLFWIVTANELGLVQMMGRPNGFARSADMVNVEFFDAVEDEAITSDATPESIRLGRPSEKKKAAIHFCKMRLLQAEISRTLYGKKRVEPTDESDPWFLQMAEKLKQWHDACPPEVNWCKEWFKSRYYTMLILLYRPSSQIPKPSLAAALQCFEAAEQVITISNIQIGEGWAELTWVFLLTIYTSLNALLWSVSYPEVRAQYGKDCVEELIVSAQEAILACSDRWPGAIGAYKLYIILGKACLDSYVSSEGLGSPAPSNNFRNPPLSSADLNSPESEDSSQQSQQPQSATSLFSNDYPFGYMFDQFTYSPTPPQLQTQPSFRSNSIFMTPTTDANGRRLSNLAPDSTNTHEPGAPERKAPTPSPLSTPIPHQHDLTPPPTTISTSSLPTSPESLAPPSAKPSEVNLSPMLVPTTQVASPSPTPSVQPSTTPGTLPVVPREPLDFAFSNLNPTRPPSSSLHQKLPASSSAFPNFTIPPPRGSNPQRTGSTRAAWNAPPPPFIQPNAFAANMNSFFENSGSQAFADGLFVGGNDETYGFGCDGMRTGNALGLPHGAATGFADVNFPWDGLGGQAFPIGRQGSLSHDQQMELMGIVDAEGLNDISAYLQGAVSSNGSNGGDGGINWAP